jgi:hypothetical protein
MRGDVAAASPEAHATLHLLRSSSLAPPNGMRDTRRLVELELKVKAR